MRAEEACRAHSADEKVLSQRHYREVVGAGSKTRLASCGFCDRFDPFHLSTVPRIRDLYTRLFENFLGEKPYGRLLDVGCGTGIYFEALATHASRIDAIDVSPDMVDVASEFCRARRLNQIHLSVGTAESLNASDETYDAVIELDTLHHVPDLERALKEIHRVLKPDGVFFVFEPNIRNPLMFLAHAIPKEERLALSRNGPRTLRALLDPYFKTLKWDGVAALITETTGVKRVILDAWVEIWRTTGLKSWYPRQAWLGKKNDAARSRLA